MAEKVTSWFVPQNLLDMVAPAQAQAAADQARNTFLFGLLSGDIGAAYNNAQNQGYNTLAHATTLAEANRKAQNQALLGDAVNQAIETAPGTGVGTADPRFLPRNTDGTEQQGPGFIPPVQRFNAQRYLANPNVARAVASDPKLLDSLYSPQIEFVNGTAVDKRNVRPGTFIPKVGENMEPIGVDPKTGRVMYAPLQGAAQSVGTLKGAEATAAAAANAAYDLVDVNLPDGSTVKVTRAQAANMAAGGSPLVAKPSPAAAANQEGYKPILEDAYKSYNSAKGREVTLQKLSSLASTLDTNSFTGAKAQITGYLNAMGITGPEANKFLTNVQSFRQGLNELASANFKDMTGAISNFDVAFTLQRQPQLTDLRQSNEFNLALMQAQDARKKEFYRFVQNNPRPDVLLRWEESEVGKKSIYEDPKLRKYLPTQPVASGPHKGKTAYIMPDGTAKVFD